MKKDTHKSYKFRKTGVDDFMKEFILHTFARILGRNVSMECWDIKYKEAPVTEYLRGNVKYLLLSTILNHHSVDVFIMLPPATAKREKLLKQVAFGKRKVQWEGNLLNALCIVTTFQSQGWMKRSSIRGMRFPNSWFGLCGLLACKTMEPYHNKWQCSFQPFPF